MKDMSLQLVRVEIYIIYIQIYNKQHQYKEQQKYKKRKALQKKNMLKELNCV